jgi:cobalt-zinc-cadmium efflux system outer membrane protein
VINQRFLIAGMLLGVALAGCARLPVDSGRSDVTTLVRAHGQEGSAAGDLEATRLLLAELAGRPLTRTDAVRLTLINNPKVTAEYARLGFAAAEVYDAGRLSNPTLSASVLVPDVGGEANQVGFGLAQNFTNLLLLPSRKRFAEGEFERIKQAVAAKVLNSAADAEAAYYRLVGAWQIAAMREAVGRATQAAADLAQRFFEAGNISRLELALQQAAASQGQIDVADARAKVTEARYALNRQMGLSATEDHWKILDRMPAPLVDEDSAPELLSLADASRLDLAAARQRVSLLADALGVTRRFRLLGEFEAGVETEREPDRSRITGPTLSLELPIFNQGRGRVARAEAALQEAEADLRELEVSISNGVQRAAADVAVAKARAEHYRTSLIPLREAIVARTQEELNYMLEGQFQLLLVKQQEYDAYQGYLEAVRDYWLARVELAREVGTVLPSSAGIGEVTLDADTLIQPNGGKAQIQPGGTQMEKMEGMEGMEGMDHSGHSMDDMPGMQKSQKPSDEPQHGDQP